MSHEIDGSAGKLPYEKLLELQDQISAGSELVANRIISDAEVIKGFVAKIAPKLAEIDMDLFPEVAVFEKDREESTMKLLEVPASGRANGIAFDFSSRKFSVRVTYITPDGKLIDLAATRRENGQRAVFVDEHLDTTTGEDIVNFQRRIFDALDRAAYKGIASPKNHRKPENSS